MTSQPVPRPPPFVGSQGGSTAGSPPRITAAACLGSPLHPLVGERYRATSTDGYQQHVVHVHPEGRYSLVALAWLPGQSTPIHDHRCWCVVGVLEGDEQEERFRLHANGEGTWLERQGVRRYHLGQTCRLVPPDEDIHRVTNVGDAAAVSLHVYGADIRACGSSINRTFDLPVRDTSSGDTVVAWRDRDPVPVVGHR